MIKFEQQRRKENGSIVFRYSDSYVVEEVLGAGWTYVLTPKNEFGRDKVRHFDSLKEIGRVTWTGISELSTPVHAPEGEAPGDNAWNWGSESDIRFFKWRPSKLKWTHGKEFFRNDWLSVSSSDDFEPPEEMLHWGKCSFGKRYGGKGGRGWGPTVEGLLRGRNSGPSLSKAWGAIWFPTVP